MINPFEMWPEGSHSGRPWRAERDLQCQSWALVPSWVLLVLDTNQRKKWSYLLPRELFGPRGFSHKGDAADRGEGEKPGRGRPH